MTIIEAINDTAKALSNLSKVLVAVGEQTKGMPAAQAVSLEAKEEAPAEPEKEVTESISVETVRAALAEKSRAGKTQEVRALLKEFGADKLSAIPADKLPDLMKKSEAL